MGRNRKPRKRYVPKHVDAAAMELAIAGAATLMPQQIAQLYAPVLAAFEQFRAGRGEVGAWMSLADALNISEALCALGIANDHIDTFEAAQEVLFNVQQRRSSGRNYTLYGNEIAALEEALEIHKIQLKFCSQSEMLKAIDLVKRRTSAALAGNASPGTTVVTGLLGASPETT